MVSAAGVVADPHGEAVCLGQGLYLGLQRLHNLTVEGPGSVQHVVQPFLYDKAPLEPTCDRAYEIQNQLFFRQLLL